MEQEKTCKCGKMNCHCKIWLLVILIVVIVLGIGGFFYYKYTFVPCADPTLCDVNLDNGVENNPNIEITENQDGTKTLKNTEGGYSLILNSGEKAETKNDSVLVFDSAEQFLPSYSLQILDNANRASLDEWLNKYNEDNWLMYFDSKEKLVVNNIIFSKIKEEGDPVVYSYYFANGEKIYVITTPEDKDYKKVLNAFSFLK
ncbi:MAG TPA: hypothetical protein DEB09_04320 [Candidatus Magasanikbacteria bacterium]|nr:hypothetical protein [Candidatus Magasanikbacteria bacterium]